MPGVLNLVYTPSCQPASILSSSSSSLSSDFDSSHVQARSLHCRNLQWARRDGTMRACKLISVENRRAAVLHGKNGARMDAYRGMHVTAAYTSEQEALVKETWAILKKDAAHHALALFLMVFEIAPAAKKLFSFLKESDVPLEKNPKLKAHALQVFVIICEAASSLSKKGAVSTPGSTMKDMAHSHMISGVVDEHYQVVRYCLLKTVQAGLPMEMWNDEVKNAWADAYDELVSAIKSQEEYLVPS